MSSNNRDDFTPNDKRVMAERVSWKCSFPGCGKNTVGPNTDDPTKKNCFVVAAIISYGNEIKNPEFRGVVFV